MKPDTAMLYQMSPLNAVRPTMAPDVTVDAVSANANWKRKKARKATPEEPYVRGVPCKKKYWCPMNPLPDPNWNAKPIAQYRIPHKHVSKTHSMSTFTVSRERANPASSPMKPACMKKTRKAVTSTQTVLTGFTKSLAPCVTVAACA